MLFAARAVTYCVVFALFAAGYGLLHDGLDGFALLKSTSWGTWLVWLVAAGTVSIAIDAAREWLFEPDHWYSTGPRRSTRLRWAVYVAAGIALVIWIARGFMPR